MTDGGNLFAQGNAPAAMSLVQYTMAIGEAVRRSPLLQSAWVMAELSDVRVNGGHCYMELIEKNQAGQTVAKLRATIWQTRFQYIRRKFYAATGRDIASGLKVMLNGATGHHPVYGLSFNVNDIDPSYTLGDLERLRREILMRLHREGILYRNKSLEMPLAPQRIAVISAAGAAGYGDFMNHLSGNAEGFVFYPVLIPAVMQGDRTSESVRDALEFVEQTIDLWDCVAIVRGGGATTDLNGFDDYDLAKAVATFPLPVVVGIGHERDNTVLDEIAHTRMKTPTAVAGFFVDSLRSAYSRAEGLMDMVTRYVADRITGEMRRLSACETILPALVDARVSSARGLLERETARIPVVVSSRISQELGKVDMIQRLFVAFSGQPTRRGGELLDDVAARFAAAASQALERNRIKLENLSGMVTALSPDNTLRRGYSITRLNGKTVTDPALLKKGETIVTQFHGGEVYSRVE